MVAFSQSTGYAPKHPAVLAANPKAQVPVLLDKGLTLYDSTVICEYLEDAYPDPPLYPREPAARARCRLIELEADEVLLVPVRALMYRSEPPDARPPAQRLQLEQQEPAAEAAILTNYDALSARLGDRHFLCDTFSVADIATFMIVHYAIRLGGPSPEHLPNLQSWYARLSERPSFSAIIAEIAAADRELSHPVAP